MSKHTFQPKPCGRVLTSTENIALIEEKERAKAEKEKAKEERKRAREDQRRAALAQGKRLNAVG